jgi:hypothetical protein
VHRASQTAEITLFFRFVDAVVQSRPPEHIHREPFTASGEYFGEKELRKWWRPARSIEDIEQRQSGDFRLSGSLLSSLIQQSTGTTVESLPSVDRFRDFYVLKVTAKVTRSLGDPYSGKLALRDFLFCRDPEAGDLKDLTRFERSSGLVFLVDFFGEAARKHKFLGGEIREACRRNGIADSGNPQTMLSELLRNCRAESLSKTLRSHVIFCDYVSVRRHLDDGVVCEVLAGLPTLIRSGEMGEEAECLRSLTVDRN